MIDLDRHVDFRVFPLADPYRVVIDLPQVDFRLAEGEGKEGRGLVKAYRFGLFASGKSRIVIDAAGPVSVEKAFVLDPQDDQPARLVVDLVASDRAAVMAAMEEERPQRESDGQESAPGSHAAVPPGTADEGRRIAIVLDPGHGGIDPGAVSRGGTREKDIVLAFSQRLKEALEEVGQFDVHLTRERDVFIPLAERVRQARELRASLFISIHADSVSTGSVNGASVYTLSERASDSVAAALAEQENRSDALAGVELVEENDAVADILIDLVRRETNNYSVFFARTLVENLREDVALVRNPHRSAGFRVLRAHDVPSILLELGYLTNTADEKLLNDEEWQNTVAKRTVEAVNAYFGEKHARGPF